MVITSPSITGVTYMDHFDFEERYRDLNECNPLHWYPLHMPAYCTDIFEKLIRARLATNSPVRVMREREKHKKGKHRDTIYSLDPQGTGYGYLGMNNGFGYPIYKMTSAEYELYNPPYSKPAPMTPYEKIVQILKEDIKNDPSNPTVTVMPSLGPVAVYNQSISKKSMILIRKLAEAFVKETKKSYDDYYRAFPKYPSDRRLYVYDSAKNKTKAQEQEKKDNKEETEKDDKAENKPEKDKNKVYRMKTKHGDVVTIVETKNLDMMKNDGFSILNIDEIKKQQQKHHKEKPKDVESMERR
ncbi:unnamed protein product [Chrysodeixis includens]|uniref:Uncharacterized protein n=1 Tax=Chrysodeixis includens TaxID=689277 RepID=A0A9N8KXZ2_CHRIL|nr:unnamed protein product [Chrysodeixis includens]